MRLLATFLVLLLTTMAKKSTKSLIESVSDHKEFKKVMRTKNNVLALFINDAKQSSDMVKVLGDVSLEVKGLATVLTVDCNDKEGKKLCKKLKVAGGKSFSLKHYKDGDFHKDYDRAERSKSLVTFLKDPAGELPWEEDPQAQEVMHLASPAQLTKLLKAEKGPVLAMFYAPWCGHCKRMKPDFQVVAKELKGNAVLAAMDVNRPENSPVSRKYNITGFPTLLYFEGGSLQYPYPGGNSKDDMKKFLADPKPEAEEKPKETAWADEPSEVVHLTDDTFDSFMLENPSALVMFYAPWCGHCKRAKPHFVSASAKMVDQGMSGKLAAVDCTIHQQLSKRFEVKGFPSIKYFKDGELAFEAGDAREEASILKFMADPKEPPPPPPPEAAWSDTESDVAHLTEADFKPFLKKKKHVLVMFYAPWCGHCKKLEPIWKHVAQSLIEAPIRVGRVDCTRFSKVATEFGIKGFPTIMFLKGDDVYTYDGDRTREDIVAFARRMMGPPVQHIHSESDMNEAKLNSLFFVYTGSLETPLYQEYHLNARHFQKEEFMYSVSPQVMSKHVQLTKDPAIYVYKDSIFYPFDGETTSERQERALEDTKSEEVTTNAPTAPTPTEPTSVLNTSLYGWVTAERFPLFVKVTRGKFSNIMATNKFVVIAVLEENKLLEISPEMEDFKGMIRQVIEKNREKYHKHFQFGWTGSPDLANSVAMETLSLPNLLVINSSTYQHHLPEDIPTYLTPEAIQIFLDSILAGEAPSYGGSSWMVRLYRAYYEAKSALTDMWRGNPVLTAVLLGLPMGFLSLIFYSICCADIMDAEEEEEEDEYHEKAE